MLKRIFIILLLAMLAIQFFRPEKNLSDDNTFAMSKKYLVPDNVDKILVNTCNDCHSNKTNYPWYAEIQPVAWWLNDHVKEGKHEVNFSEFTKKPIAVQNHKFEEIIEQVEEKEMPLASYANFGLHPEAKISDEERKVLIDWAKAQMDSLKANYPADSLILKRKPALK
jgi:Haem-binding domain